MRRTQEGVWDFVSSKYTFPKFQEISWVTEVSSCFKRGTFCFSFADSRALVHGSPFYHSDGSLELGSALDANTLLQT